jgi:exopolysaccharide biosynthesis polyprenyl glycosylphosphotransferase
MILQDLGIVGLGFLAANRLLFQGRSLMTLFENHSPKWAGFLLIRTSSGEAPQPADWLWVMLVVALVTLVVNDLWGAYGPLYKQSFLRIIACSAGAPFVGLSVATLIQFGLKNSAGVSRLLLFLAVAFSGLGLMAYRLVQRGYFKTRLRRGYYAKNTVVLGRTASVEWIARFFSQEVSSDEYRISGFLSTQANEALPAAALNLRCLGKADDLGELLIHQPIHEVVAIQSACDALWLAKVVSDCDYFRVPLWIVPEALIEGELRDLQFALKSNAPLHLPAVVLRPHEFNSEALFIKRLIDLAVAAVLLALLAPLFILIAIAIKITNPELPVFYRWRVVGLKGKEFTGYKFTTMAANADERKDQLTLKNEMSGPVFKIKNDPRITRLGRFLRKFSLNELPQLWSVLNGDMSLVGPRPAFPHELARYQFWHKRKLSVQPGITCLWQIRGRNKISNFDEWVKMDLEYIHHWSLRLDFEILAKTAWIVVKGTGS